MVKMRPQHTMPTILRILLSVLFLMAMAVVLTWFTLWRQFLCSANATWGFIGAKPLIFWYSAVIIFLLLAVVAAIFWQAFFGAGVVFALLSILTFIHMQKTQLRSEPLYPEDLLMADQAENIAGFVDQGAIWRLAGGVVFVLIGTLSLEYCVRRVVGRDKSRLAWWDRWALVPRVTCAMLALVGLMMTTSFLINHKTEGFAKEIGLEFDPWRSNKDYPRNGIILSFTYYLGDASVTPPSEYNEETMKKLIEKYRGLKAQDDERKKLGDTVDNIIVILDESFYDPEIVAKYYPHEGGDVVPNLHKIFQKYPSGYMFSPVYGGGTSNVEFEVLTGLSNYWLNTMPYNDTLPKLDKVSGIVSFARSNDFSATAIHPYFSDFYRRDEIYQRMGYETFLSHTSMKYIKAENDHGYASDRSVYEEILATLDESDGPQMIGAVTMQNHGPYASAGYASLDFKLKNEAEKTWDIENWYQSVHKADEYLGEFVRKLDKRKDRTVVLWFGDHAAGIFDELVKSTEPENELIRLTPYFVYANFDIDSQYTEDLVAKLNKDALGFEVATTGVDLPTTTPNCLMNTMYNILQAEKPLLMYALDEVCRKAPILTHNYSKDGKVDPQVLRDYRLINYDLLNGKHYWPE